MTGGATAESPDFGSTDTPGRDASDGAQRSVLGRVSAILNAFDRDSPELSLADLSARTGLPKSTVHRLADQMHQVGWIDRHDGRYRVGMRMFELGSLAVEGNRLQDAAYPLMQSLSTKTGMATQLAVLDGLEIVYLERVGSAIFPVPVRPGDRRPAYCTAAGKALIAFDEDAKKQVLSSEMPRRTAHTITSPDAMAQELARVRELGVAFDRGEENPSLVCVAAPIRGQDGALGALSLTAPAGRLRWDMATGAVRSTAAAIWNAFHRVESNRGRHPRG